MSSEQPSSAGAHTVDTVDEILRSEKNVEFLRCLMALGGKATSSEILEESLAVPNTVELSNNDITYRRNRLGDGTSQVDGFHVVESYPADGEALRVVFDESYLVDEWGNSAEEVKQALRDLAAGQGIKEIAGGDTVSVELASGRAVDIDTGSAVESAYEFSQEQVAEVVDEEIAEEVLGQYAEEGANKIAVQDLQNDVSRLELMVSNLEDSVASADSVDAAEEDISSLSESVEDVRETADKVAERQEEIISDARTLRKLVAETLDLARPLIEDSNKISADEEQQYRNRVLRLGKNTRDNE